MGSIIKSGTAPISGVVPPGERARGKGLLYAATPASDFICGTLQLAAGMTLHVFTTGRGTPYGLAAVPVIKVATRSELARRWHDLMDVDAGRIATGSATPRHPPRCARTQPPSPCAVHGRTASQSTPWCKASSAPTLTRRGRGAADRQATEECFAARAMMGCVGEPRDVANAVVFLASPQSGWITAQTLTVDGGQMDYIGHG